MKKILVTIRLPTLKMYLRKVFDSREDYERHRETLAADIKAASGGRELPRDWETIVEIDE